MCLEGEAPYGMALYVINGLGDDETVAVGIAGVDGLQESGMADGEVNIGVGVLVTVEEYLDLVGTCEAGLGCRTKERLFGRERYPVEIGGQGEGSVGLDGHEVAFAVQEVDECLGDL